MKKSIFLLFLLSWLSYFNFIAKDDFQTDLTNQTSTQSIDHEDKISTVSSIDFSCYLSHTEYQFNAENPSFPTLKNTFQFLVIQSKQIEFKLNSYFKQFTSFSVNKLYSSLKLSILFPFHCFW